MTQTAWATLIGGLWLCYGVGTWVGWQWGKRSGYLAGYDAGMEATRQILSDVYGAPQRPTDYDTVRREVMDPSSRGLLTYVGALVRQCGGQAFVSYRDVRDQDDHLVVEDDDEGRGLRFRLVRPS